MSRYIIEYPVNHYVDTCYNIKDLKNKIEKLIPKHINQDWVVIAAFGIIYHIYNKDTNELIAKISY